MSPADLAALKKFGASDLGLAVALIPIELGCRVATTTTAAHRAALLLPWQFLLKYDDTQPMIIMLAMGVWSTVAGGCTAIAGQAISAVKETAATTSGDVDAKLAALTGGAEMPDLSAAASTVAKVSGGGMTASGIVILLAGLLALVAGVLLFVNKGRMFALVAPGVGILGELLFFALVSFSVIGMFKIALYGIGVLGARSIGTTPSVSSRHVPASSLAS